MTQHTKEASVVDVNDLSSLTTKELVDNYIRCLSGAAMSLGAAAQCVAELERRGYDLSTLPGPARRLLLVASGKLLPDVYARFFSNYFVCNKLIGLSHDQQRRALTPVTLVTRVADGTKSETRLVNLEAMSVSQVAQVIGHDHIRTEREQQLYLDSAAAAAERRPAPAVDPLSRVPASDRKWLANEARRRGVTPRTIFTEMKNAYIAARAVQRVQERVKDSA